MTLLMLQLEVSAKGLARWAHAHDLPDDDQGYLLHRLLRDAFGPLAPQPFRWFAPTGRAPGRLLAYGRHDAEELRAGLTLAQPLLEAAIPAAAIASKPMRHLFPPGTTLGFEVQACPIVRTKGGDGHKPRELDVFLHRALAASKEEPLERDAVYRAWLAERLLAAGAEAAAVCVHRQDQVPLVRRAHPAAPRRLFQTRDGRRVMARRPDVTFRGNLRVGDPDRFSHLIATGLGRHRAFGYGMLLLRPAGQP